jgi:hypothetical protein
MRYLSEKFQVDLKLMPIAFQYKIQLQVLSRTLNFTRNLQVEFSSFYATCEGLGQCSPHTFSLSYLCLISRQVCEAKLYVDI